MANLFDFIESGLENIASQPCIAHVDRCDLCLKYLSQQKSTILQMW